MLFRSGVTTSALLMCLLLAASSAWPVQIGDILVASRDEGVNFSGYTNVRDEDVMLLRSTSANPVRSGTWSLFFDGSANGIYAGTGIDAIHYFADEGPDPGVPDLLFSLKMPTTIAGTYYEKSDIIAYDIETGTYSMFFQGRAHGLGTWNIDAVGIYGNSIIISIWSGYGGIPGMGYVGGQDLLAFTPTIDGDWNGPGTWSMFLDGSDIGLDTEVEDIDGVEVMTYAEAIALGLNVAGIDVDPGLPVIFFSTEALSGSLNAASGGLRFEDEDIVAFFPRSLGANTTGTGILFFDGSALGMASGYDAETNAFAIISSAGGAAIPEPGTVVLLAANLFIIGGLGCRRSRRK